jgi:hypothetical protein
MSVWVLIFVGAIYLGFLVAIIQSVRLGRIVRLNREGLTKAQHPIRFWFHIASTFIATSLFFGLMLSSALKGGIQW